LGIENNIHRKRRIAHHLVPRRGQAEWAVLNGVSLQARRQRARAASAPRRWRPVTRGAPFGALLHGHRTLQDQASLNPWHSPGMRGFLQTSCHQLLHGPVMRTEVLTRRRLRIVMDQHVAPFLSVAAHEMDCDTGVGDRKPGVAPRAHRPVCSANRHAPTQHQARQFHEGDHWDPELVTVIPRRPPDRACGAKLIGADRQSLAVWLTGDRSCPVISEWQTPHRNSRQVN
jgi:hypothetical protein